MLTIKHKLRGLIFEAEKNNTNIWYHGSPEVQKLEQQGGFSEKYIDGEYITDLEGFHNFQKELHAYHDAGNMDAYHKLLDRAKDFKDTYKFKSPIFLSNDYGVAKTYADSRRAIDYQNAVEGILKVEVDTGRNLSIIAYGDRFRFIELDKVKAGFVKAGISGEEFDDVVSRFNYYLKDRTKIKTDMIAAIAAWFGFDTVDVVGVLDSYHGGTVKSTVRMVFDPNAIKIIK